MPAARPHRRAVLLASIAGEPARNRPEAAADGRAGIARHPPTCPPAATRQRPSLAVLEQTENCAAKAAGTLAKTSPTLASLATLRQPMNVGRQWECAENKRRTNCGMQNCIAAMQTNMAVLVLSVL